MPGSVRGEGGKIQGFQRVWTPPVGGDLFQIIVAVDISGGKQLAGVRHKPGKGAGGVSEVDKDSHQVGGGAAGVHIFI